MLICFAFPLIIERVGWKELMFLNAILELNSKTMKIFMDPQSRLIFFTLTHGLATLTEKALIHVYHESKNRE